MKAVLSSRWPPGTRELGVADRNYRAMLVKAVPCVWVREGTWFFIQGYSCLPATGSHGTAVLPEVGQYGISTQ